MPSKQKSPDSVKTHDLLEKREDDSEKSSEETWVHETKSEPETKESTLTLKLSSTLVRKLTEKAQVEGVSVEDFASELLAEGLVLRAWEIVEKKNAMRGTNSTNSSPSQSAYRNQKFGYRNNNNQNGYVKRMQNDNGPVSKSNSRQNYKNIMEDNANFLEYVRNQEKNRDKY